MPYQEIDVNPELQQQCQIMIYDDFKKEFSDSIAARNRWQIFNKVFDVTAHLSAGASTALSFISTSSISSSVQQPIGIAAGCCGATSIICMSFSQYCKAQYQNATKEIKEMAENMKLHNVLIDASQNMNNALARQQCQPLIFSQGINNSHCCLPLDPCQQLATTNETITVTTTASPSIFSQEVNNSHCCLPLNPCQQFATTNEPITVTTPTPSPSPNLLC